MILSHLISPSPLRGVSKCVFSCTRISDKVPGKLGGASTGDTRLLQNLPDMMLPEAKFAQASKFRTSIQNSPSEAEFLRIRQVACSEFASIQIFHPSAFPVPSHDSCSPSDHVKTKHWEKQHHAVTSLFLSVVGCLLNSRKFWCSGLLLSAFFSGNWLERLEASLVFVGDSKTPHLIGDTHDPCTQRFEHHVCHNPALRETAPCRYQPFLSVVGCLLNSRKFWCSGLLLSAFSVELALNAVKLPLVLCWSKQHKVTDILSTMFHVTTQHRGKQHTRLRTIFWFAKSCPTACCVWKALNQRVSAGGHPSHHWWMANEEANDESCKRTCDLPPSDMARWLSHKPPMQTWHANMI